MNRTVIFVTFAILAALGIIGTVILLVHRPDATATFTSFVITILGLVTVAATTFYGLGKATEKLEVVEKNTNGRLEALLARAHELERENAALRATHPDTKEKP